MPFYPHADAFIISANVVEVEVQCILIEGGCSVYLLFTLAFDQMGLSRTQLTRVRTPLCCFKGYAIEALGQISCRCPSASASMPAQRTSFLT